MSQNGNMGGSLAEGNSALLRHVNNRTMIDALVLLLTKITSRSGYSADELCWLDTALEACSQLPWTDGAAPAPDGLIGISWPFADGGVSGLWFTTLVLFDPTWLHLFYGYDARPETGETNFCNAMTWYAYADEVPELEDDHLKELGTAGFAPFHAAVEALDCASGFTVDITFGNGEDDYVMPERQPRRARTSHLPATAEEHLRRLIDEAKGRKLNIERYAAPERCDICACDFNRGELLVDGRLRDSITFADMCPRCACLYGSGIGYGDGQLYLRQPDDSWLCVAGFPPDDSIDTQ
ncbi:MAG: hypothetical protein M5R41_06145 [Bacteroidia bacterium]|nr:hypothetical protein [Bacteroidia bacterium]